MYEDIYNACQLCGMRGSPSRSVERCEFKIGGLQRIAFICGDCRIPIEQSLRAQLGEYIPDLTSRTWVPERASTEANG